MGKVMISGVAPQMTVPIVLPANFSDATWEQIIEACKKKRVPSSWVVGSQKNMTINGTDYVIDIIGKNHDEYADGSGKAPLTFQMHDCYDTTYQMNSSNTNVGGWTSCAMRTTHLPAILALMPSEVITGIKEVKKLTSTGNMSATIQYTSDKLFLLSSVEVYGNDEITDSFSGEGIQYDYYKAGNSKKKNVNGTFYEYWLRSPRSQYTNGFNSVHKAGVYNSCPATDTNGVSFAFCF